MVQVVRLPDETLPARLREPSETHSFLVFQQRENECLVVVGHPLTAGMSKFDILLGAYAGTIGQRSPNERWSLWGAVIGAGTCDTHGNVREWSDSQIQAYETPLSMRPAISAALEQEFGS